ncbi:MAG: FAD-dependent oxidoreductase [Gammaproteobacteria bacterium]|nr:MAG: FAD-dependent oxidoreductase [Gammaproteobacteria bacterium]
MIQIIGSGIVGLTLADHLLNVGQRLHITTANSGVDDTACSWWAGGMLAPFCEMESAEPLVGELSPYSMNYWRKLCEADNSTNCRYEQNGTVVISPNRDHNMLTHFAQKTQAWERMDAQRLHTLEPVLSAHRDGLFYASEAHIEPRQVLQALWDKVRNRAPVTTDTSLSEADIDAMTSDSPNDWVLDCRGFDARQQLADLRGVRGEMLHLYNPELSLSRPVRLLHPRIPIYLVPRANGQLMLGATMIENASRERASVRSVLELLSALYAVNPAFSQSEIVEIGVDVRPAYPDNLPKIVRRGKRLHINGMYRHGYLLAPALAKIACDYLTQQKDNPLIIKE